ncbi:nitroreductase family protein [Carnobacterium sp. 1290_CSPC]|uniref:nitroreductase family protein n=1 Tax=Carnobacterium sp. 1290_CSPC TaxID=1579347 RepID=UPI0006613D29|nr:nitroreductase family protein [Carnobacterium sp. 1290_CSPC]
MESNNEESVVQNKQNKSLFNRLRTVVESVLTDKQIRQVKQLLYKSRLNKAYKFDQKIYSNNSFGFVPEYTLDNLRGKITLHYHSIEKGMSNKNIRLGFGQRAFRDLFYSMDSFMELGYPSDDERFLSAVNIIRAYVKYHDDHNFEVENVREHLTRYLKYCENQELNDPKPNRTVNLENIKNTLNYPFDQFSSSRMSVRDYENSIVNLELVEEAINIASHTPSVCNRQPWKVYVIENKDKIVEALNIQKGLNLNERNNVPLLLAITVDTSYYSSDKERNEPFVDGGLFSMSLLYALHFKGLAACSLNANMSNKDLIEEHKLLGTKNSERLIMFVSVGNYTEKVIAPLSDRDSFENYIKYVR